MIYSPAELSHSLTKEQSLDRENRSRVDKKMADERERERERERGRRGSSKGRRKEADFKRRRTEKKSNKIRNGGPERNRSEARFIHADIIEQKMMQPWLSFGSTLRREASRQRQRHKIKKQVKYKLVVHPIFFFIGKT